MHGHGRYKDRHREFEYGPHTVILTRKNFWYRYLPVGDEPLEHLWVRFRGPAVDALIHLMDFTKTNPIIEFSPSTNLAPQFLHLHELCRSDMQSAVAEATAIALALLANAIHRIHLREHGGVDKPDAIDHFILFAQENTGETSIDIKSFAREHGIGYEVFRKSFRRRMSMAPHAYWLHCKLNLARALLEKSDTPISDISETVGYPTVYAFSAYFKRRTRQSPTEYRRLHRR
jgi:AraC-like DNA-binding protein